MDRKDAPPGGYDRIAGLYDLLLLPLEAAILSRHRRGILARTRNCPRVLEVGVGTGKNFPHYAPAGSRTGGGEHEIVAIDLSPRMLRAARARARRLHMQDRVDFRTMDVEALDFPDQHFDCAVATFVFCSVVDPARGLAEIYRVLRPGGRLTLLEHVRSDHPVLGRIMDAVNPLSSRLLGVHINRDTTATVRAAGFRIQCERNLGLDVLREIVAVRRPGGGDGGGSVG